MILYRCDIHDELDAVPAVANIQIEDPHGQPFVSYHVCQSHLSERAHRALDVAIERSLTENEGLRTFVVRIYRVMEFRPTPPLV